jgi:hypothetical protein
MENPILQMLKPINFLSVNTATWVFRRSFDDFYGSVRNMPLERIDDWITNLQNPYLMQGWVLQRQMAYPHLFFYGMLRGYQYEVLKENKYQRDSLEGITAPDSNNDFEKQTLIVKQVTDHVLSLPFDEGVAFLGKMIGTWMLTCPEVIIRSENNVEAIGERRVGKLTTNWRVPRLWIKGVYSGSQNKSTGRELQLLYVLDFFIHWAFEDYDMANIS